MDRADFTVGFDLVMEIADIPEDELEDYIFDIQMALAHVFSSSDIDDDHFRVKVCNPRWDKIKREYLYVD